MVRPAAFMASIDFISGNLPVGTGVSAGTGKGWVRSKTVIGGTAGWLEYGDDMGQTG
jgi:hypothetical protein